MHQPVCRRAAPLLIHACLSLALIALVALSTTAPALAHKPIYASIVVDANTGEVLHAVDADAVTYPASTTKMMTLYLLFGELQRGRLKMDTALPVSEYAAAQAPSKLGVEAGRTISVRDAMLGLVTKSANDMAVVFAEAIGGSETAFAERMTKQAKALGMRHTKYVNASGLPDPDQVTTARDLATLALAILRDYPAQYRVFSTRDFVFEGHVLTNHNKLLGRYAGLDGIKTGYIRASGFNLVASAERNGRRLVGVVLGGNTPGWRDRHMAQLLDKSFIKAPSILTASAPATNATPSIAPTIKQRPGRPAPEPVIATSEPPPPEPIYTEDMDQDKPTIADLVSDDAAEEIAQSGDWAVQVGAFNKTDAAQRAIDDARRALPGPLLASARPFVDETRPRRSRLYQARLIGMTETDARNACKQLKKWKIECMVVPPTPANAVRPGLQAKH